MFRRHHLQLALRLTEHAYRVLTGVVIAAGLLFALLVLALRFAVLPNVDRWRPEIEAAASAAAGQRISIDAVSGAWRGSRPSLRMEGVVVHDASGRPALAIGEAEVTLALRSLLLGSVQLHHLVVSGSELVVRRDARGALSVAGFPVNAAGGDSRLMEWFLGQPGVEVRDATVTWIDESRGAPPLVVRELNLRMEGGLVRTRFGLSMRPPPELGVPLDIRGDLRRPRTGEAQPWRGRLYVSVPYVNLGGLQPWVDLPARMDSGAGELQAWFELDEEGLVDALADVRLAGLGLGLSGDLPALALRALQGRLHWVRRDGGGFEAQARRLSVLPLAGEPLREANLVLRRGAARDPGAEIVVEADRLELAVLTTLAPALPLPEHVRALVGTLRPAGRVEALSIRIPALPGGQGRGVQVSGRLQDVSLAPAERWPGVTGLSGRIQSDASGGRLEVDSTPISLVWPRLFEEPLRFDRLQLAADWNLRGGSMAVTLNRFAAIGRDFTATAAGSWQSAAGGGGVVDLSLAIPEVRVATVPRYVPLQAGPGTRAWLSSALQGGTARDVRLRLKGDLRQFPFAAPGSGLFEVTARVEQGRLAFAPGWPMIEDIQAALAFRGQGMAVEGSARTLGLRIGRASVGIADMAHHDAVLAVKGDAQGPVAEMLRYLEISPVGGWIGNAAAGASGGGSGRLALDLSLPLARMREARVRGALSFADASLTGAKSIPDLARIGGTLQFSEAGASVADATASVFGMPVRFGMTAGAGGVVINGTGRLRAEALRERFQSGWLKHLEGETAWRATLSVRRGRAEFQVDSDLEGLAVLLPDPLAKPAGERLPLRVQRRARGRADVLLVNAQGRLDASLLLDATPDGPAVRRGAVSLGAGPPARLPDRDGVFITGGFDRIDIDEWQDVLAGMKGEGSASATGGTSFELGGIDLRAREVEAFGRSIDAVTLSLRREDGRWGGRIDSRQVQGEIDWETGGRGRLRARLSRLHLPDPATEAQVSAAEPIEGRNLPAFDVVSESFRMGSRDFGRLELQAVPNGPGWQMDKLELSSPEGSIRARGGWQRVRGVPLSQFAVKVESSDVGRYLRRLGLPEGVAGGEAMVEGPLEWRGNPYSLDLPSLTGQLRLDAQKGQFTKIEPGIAKLLGVLSLQSLPRRVSLDFRDIFSQGFAFDRITGSFAFASGVVRTEDLRMIGSAAKVSMSGSLNLPEETQSLLVRVVPSIGDSIAVGTAIVNPAVGLATLIVGRVLKNPIDEAAAFEYRVTGSLTDPKVERVQRPPPEGGQGQVGGTKIR